MLARVTASQDRLDFVQGLRGIAAAAVVLYHARVFIDGGAYLNLGTRLFGSGGAGVDLFFIISGLIMVHTTRAVVGTPRDGVAFVIRRFARIWPVYVVAFAAMFALTHSLPGPAFSSTVTTVRKTLTFYPLAPHETAPFFGYPRLHVGWSLVYEACFYVLFAIALVTRRWRWLTLAALFAGCLIVWPWIATGDYHFDAMRGYRTLDGYAVVATSPIMWNFAFGVAIGLIRQTRYVPSDRGLWACAVAITVGAVVWQLLSGYRHGHGPTNWGLPLAVMVLTLTLYDKAFPIAMPRVVRWLGDISFSLYMFHILPQMLPRLIKDQPTLVTGGGFFVASIVVGVVLAYLSHRWLERGLSEWLRRRLLALVAPRSRSIAP